MRAQDSGCEPMVRHGRAASMNGSRSKAGMTVVGVAAEEAGIASYSDVIPDLVGDLSRPVRSEVPDEIHSASMDPLRAERTNVVPTHVLTAASVKH